MFSAVNLESLKPTCLRKAVIVLLLFQVIHVEF